MTSVQAFHSAPLLPHLPPPQTVGRSRSRQLREACPRLFRDLLAVLSGLRPAFMIDYGALLPAHLAAAAAELAATLQLQAAAAELVMVLLNDCCYLVRPVLLPSLGSAEAEAADKAAASAQRPRQQQPQQPPQQQQQWLRPAPPPLMFVAFDQQQPRWATDAEAAEAAAQLAALQQGLLAAVAAAQQQQQQHKGAPACIPIIDPADVPGWQALAPPTASGYLLGYPALYLVRSQEGAQAASRALSTSSLCLHSVGCQLRTAEGVPVPKAQPLLAFSVPGELAAAPGWQACRTAWWSRLRQRHCAAVQAGLAWSEPELESKAQPPRPVAL